jgi:hypothetical protein
MQQSRSPQVGFGTLPMQTAARRGDERMRGQSLGTTSPTSASQDLCLGFDVSQEMRSRVATLSTPVSCLVDHATSLDIHDVISPGIAKFQFTI